jgi:hypothetical protein
MLHRLPMSQCQASDNICLSVQQELLQGKISAELGSFSQGRLTDLSLSLLQDSGWYDIKYGSAGVSTHGYHAGCDFALARTSAVLQDASAKRYLCPAGLTTTCFISSCYTPLITLPLTSDAPYQECLSNKPANCTVCVSDHSATGVCIDASPLLDGFVFPTPVRPSSFQRQCAEDFMPLLSFVFWLGRAVFCTA